MNNLHQEFSTSYKEGKLLESIYKNAQENWSDLDALIAYLIKFHNDGDIDLIASFSTLKNDPNLSLDFFSTRRILEKSLSELDSPVAKVMECVVHLIKEAGQDMLAGALLPPFTNFCAASPSRPKEALSLIEKFPEKYVNLLPQVAIAGARLDINFYFDESIRLSKHDDIDIRKRAIFSLGRIEHLEKDDLIEKAIFCLESSVTQETDDHLLANIIGSAFSLHKYSKVNIERIADIVNQALQKGDNIALHTGAVLFGSNAKELPDILLNCFLSRLLRVKPENDGSLDYIDVGLAALIDKGRWEGVDFLEKFLLDNSEKITIDIFDSVMHECFKNQNNTLNRLMTRWFIKGDRALCEGIRSIANLAHEKNIQLSVEPSDFDCFDPIRVIFLARKSIGYLFSTPVTAASIIVSLMRCAPKETIQTLITLLFDPLLISYPGKVKDYLTERADVESDEVKENLKITIKLFEDYLENIKSVGNIPELHPSQSQRDIYNRRFLKIMSQAMKDAQKDSIFLSLVSTSVLLYGRKSIDYVYTSDGQSNRMEIPLHSHDTEMEFPRLGTLDPFGLDYMLRVFRVEQIR